MPNPAKLLADMVEPFTVQHGEQVVARRMRITPEGPGAIDFWEDHRRAVGFLEEIDIAIRGMEAMGEDVTHWRSQYDEWHSFVFAIEVNWSATPSGGVSMPLPSLSMLRALAQVLDVTNYAPEESPADLVMLQQAIAEARALVVEVGFPADTARYLLSLLREAEDVITEYQLYGSVRLRSVTLKLGGAMLMTSGEDVVTRDPAKAKRYKQLAGKLMMGVAITLGSQHGALAIEQIFGFEPDPLAIEAPAQKQIEAPAEGDVEG